MIPSVPPGLRAASVVRQFSFKDGSQKSIKRKLCFLFLFLLFVVFVVFSTTTATSTGGFTLAGETPTDLTVLSLLELFVLREDLD